MQTMPDVIRGAQNVVMQYADRIRSLIPRDMDPNQIIHSLASCLARTPKLAECNRVSLVACMVDCAHLGLKPSTPAGHCWIIPYKTTATLVIGYQGYMHLMWRSGLIQDMSCDVVREKDDFDYRLGTEKWVKHKPYWPSQEAGKMVAAYAVISLNNGGQQIAVLDRDEIYRRRDCSAPVRAGRDTPWKHPEFEPAMWKKTAMRSASNWAPKSTELLRHAMALEDQAETAQGVQQFRMIQHEVLGDGPNPDELRDRVAEAKKRNGRNTGGAKPSGQEEDGDDDVRKKLDAVVGDIIKHRYPDIEPQNVDDAAAKIIEQLSSYESNGKTIPGKGSVGELAGGRLRVTYGKAKKALEELAADGS